VFLKPLFYLPEALSVSLIHFLIEAVLQAHCQLLAPKIKKESLKIALQEKKSH